MKLAVVGVTGLVGTEILKVLEERNFYFSTLIPVASERSVGKKISFKSKEYTVVSMDDAISMAPDIAIFSAGGATSLEHAPRFAAVGTRVIDNSSAWRMDATKKLVVPEVNANEIGANDMIIANPNCSTIQMVVALKPLHDAYTLKRVIVSTYQSVTGSGQKGVDQLMNERNGVDGFQNYPHKIDMNAIPHIDSFLDNGYTKEEMKMVNETRKIMGLPNLGLTSTTVRIPTMGGHSEALNIEFEKEFDLAELKALLGRQEGLIVVDNPAKNEYPMPLMAHGKDEVFVGRIRRDESQPKTVNLWIVADNLRKGAATNAVQIAESLVKEQVL